MKVNLRSCLLLLGEQTCKNYFGEDGLGFSSADKEDGIRLVAALKAGIDLRGVEIARGKELVSKYSNQLVQLFEGKVEAAELQIGKIKSHKYNFSYDPWESYIDISSSQKFVNFYVLSKELSYETHKFLSFIANGKYGERDIVYRCEKDFEYNYLGTVMKLDRWQISYNESTRLRIIDFARNNRILISPILFYKIPLDEQFLQKSNKICRLRKAVRNKKLDTYFVLDMGRPDYGVVERIKTETKGYSCRKQDDYDWYIPNIGDNIKTVKDIIMKNKFLCCQNARGALFKK